MIYARIELESPYGDADALVVRIPLHEGYGGTAEVAHQLLGICLTAAEHPVVIHSAGGVLHVPRELLRSFATWEHDRT